MLKKILLIILIPYFLYSCDYSPIYSKKNNKNINFKILKTSGDKDINRYIQSNLKRYSNIEGKLINLKINTDYSMSVISRDNKGSASNYQLSANTSIEITSEDLNKTISFQENFVMKNFSDNFEKKNYEKTIKKNFSNSISSELILRLNNSQ